MRSRVRVPQSPPKDTDHPFGWSVSFIVMGDSKFKCDMPVAYRIDQFKNWSNPLKTESPSLHQKTRTIHLDGPCFFVVGDSKFKCDMPVARQNENCFLNRDSMIPDSSAILILPFPREAGFAGSPLTGSKTGGNHYKRSPPVSYILRKPSIRMVFSAVYLQFTLPRYAS